MSKKLLVFLILLCVITGCASVVVKSQIHFSKGATSEEVIEQLGYPLRSRTIVDSSGDEFEIYRYNAQDFFGDYNRTPFYNKNTMLSTPTDIVFKNGKLVLQGVSIQGKLRDEALKAEKELLRSVKWHLEENNKKYRTSVFW